MAGTDLTDERREFWTESVDAACHGRERDPCGAFTHQDCVDCLRWVSIFLPYKPCKRFRLRAGFSMGSPTRPRPCLFQDHPLVPCSLFHPRLSLSSTFISALFLCLRPPPFFCPHIVLKILDCVVGFWSLKLSTFDKGARYLGVCCEGHGEEMEDMVDLDVGDEVQVWNLKFEYS